MCANQLGGEDVFWCRLAVGAWLIPGDERSFSKGEERERLVGRHGAFDDVAYVAVSGWRRSVTGTSAST